MKEETTAIKSYSHKELASLYGVGIDAFNTWITRYEKDLKKLHYKKGQRLFTVAQVKYLFRDDVLGHP